MYRCLDCGNKFETPKRYVERHGFDTPPFEEYHGCPKCGGAFEEFDEYEEESEDEETEDE